MNAPRIFSRRPRRRGFTLIEAALTTTIIGVGVVSMLQLLASGTVSNIDGAKQTTGINLARDIREMALQDTFDQVRGLNSTTYKPAVDSQGHSISDLSDWSQSIVVQQVDPKNLTKATTGGSPVAICVTVTVLHNAEKVSDLSWYQFHAAP
jgi:Tfp pilus assembly protein PilV